MYKKQKGFTLVEMIIVTVIIGILAGMVITVINIPRIQARSRDSRRIGDIKRIQSALELYFSDYREYPGSASWVIFSDSNINDIGGNGRTYISDVPEDPRTDTSEVQCFRTVAPGNNPYGYYYRSLSGGTYILGAVMELDSGATDSPCSSFSTECTTDGYECNITSPLCYCVKSPM